MALFLYQLKQALVSLKQKPTFVFSVVTTMGITLGALLCVLTLNYLLLIEPLPYPDQDRLYVAEHGFIDPKKNNDGFDFSYPGLVHLYKSKVAFEQAAMLLHGEDVILSNNEHPLVNTAYVTPEFHQMLASPMAKGRMFEATEALDTYNPVVMLSYNMWQQKFNGNVDILEQKITLSGVSFRVVGVLAENFVEPALAEIGRKTHVWLPWDYNQTGERHRQRFGNTNRKLKFIGQLKEGVSHSQAQQLLTPLVNDRWQEGVAEINFFKGWSVEMRVRSVKEVILGNSDSIAVMLFAGVVGLVLIASGNISNLFMSRTAEKHRQMAIEAAMGACKKHLYKGLLAETSLLMFMSVIVALVISRIGFYIIQQYLDGVLPRVNELALNSITYSLAMLAILFFALLFAKLNTRMINYRALNTTLNNSGKSSGLQISKKTRQLLIASQVALATVLVFANISLLKDAMKTINAPIGFTTDNISTLVLNYSSTDFPSQEESEAIIVEIKDKIESLPQVNSISQSSTPLDGFGILTITNLVNNEKYTPYSKWVDEKYFTMIEQQLLQGQDFTLVDRRERNNVMIVNQAFAKRLKDDGDVLGMEVSTGRPEPYKIIAIVKDIYISGEIVKDKESEDVPRVYRANRLGTQSFMIKFNQGQSVSRKQLGTLLAEVDSRYSVLHFNSASDALKKSLFANITMAVITGALAIITFLLAIVGLYGILNYSTQMRRFEIGTRMAIGAKGRDIIALVIKENASAILIGVALAIVCLLALYLGFSQYLVTFINVQLILVALITLLAIASVAFIACYLPLKRYIKQPVSCCLKGSE